MEYILQYELQSEIFVSVQKSIYLYVDFFKNKIYLNCCNYFHSDDVRCTSVIDVVRVTVNEANPSSPPLSTKVDHGESKLG